jgi:hypothetical protein
MWPGEGRKGIEDVMSRSSPYVFTPVPEVFRDRLVSDSFIAAAENGARIPIRRAVGDSFLLGCRASSG